MKQTLKNITCALAMITMTTGQYVAAQTPTSHSSEKTTRIQRMKTAVTSRLSKPHPKILVFLIASSLLLTYLCFKLYHKVSKLKEKNLSLEEEQFRQSDTIYHQQLIIDKYKEKYPDFKPNLDQL